MVILGADQCMYVTGKLDTLVFFFFVCDKRVLGKSARLYVCMRLKETRALITVVGPFFTPFFLLDYFQFRCSPTATISEPHALLLPFFCLYIY